MYVMSRLHVHLHVRDLAQSVRFYSALFGTEPTRIEDGYAKWMLENPKVNFALSIGAPDGVSHLGIQVEDENELAGVSARAQSAAGTLLVEKDARCCYARSNKAWATDPQGVQWETFHTLDALEERGTGAAATYVTDSAAEEDTSSCGCIARKPAAPAAACCAP
jgi:catechol 2,3-dioxygenase-like lactoylglutathione lyase family enzyme